MTVEQRHLIQWLQGTIAVAHPGRLHNKYASTHFTISTSVDPSQRDLPLEVRHEDLVENAIAPTTIGIKTGRAAD